MRSLALLALPLLLAACGSPNPPPALPPAPTASAAAPAPTAAKAATAAAAEPPAPPEAPSPFFPVVVNGGASLRFFALTKGGVVVDGDWMSQPYLVDETGARLERRLYAGLKGVGDEGAFVIYEVRGDWPRSGGGESVVRLALGPAAKGLPIAWRVAYQRVEHPITDESEDAVVAGEVEIAAGVLR